MGRLARHLLPTDEEIQRLALRETDPRREAEFTPITRGPVFAIVSLLVLGLAAVIVTPFRLLSRSSRSRDG